MYFIKQRFRIEEKERINASAFWVGFNYWMAFRSPIYQALSRKSDYAFNAEEVNRAAKYMK